MCTIGKKAGGESRRLLRVCILRAKLKWKWVKIHFRGIIAQLEERMLHTHEVTGSSPVGPINRMNALGGSKWPAFCYVHMNVHTGAVWQMFTAPNPRTP